MHNFAPYKDFASASAAVLKMLHARFGFDLWMVTRTEGDNWTVLHIEDHGYNISAGTVLKWSDSYCSRMVRGEGPQVAPIAKNIEAFALAPINKQVQIGSYIGIPLLRRDGSLFGTLCAIDPNEQLDSIKHDLPLLKTLSSLLASVLCAELELLDQARQLERIKKDSVTDPLTGLLNRRGWDQRIAAEESRVARYASPASVFSVDLDELKEVNDREGHAAGDELLSRTASVLSGAIRATDSLARVGGDEFMILAVETDEAASQLLYQRIVKALTKAQIKASVGFAIRSAQGSLLQAWEEADRSMYKIKAAHRDNSPH